MRKKLLFFLFFFVSVGIKAQQEYYQNVQDSIMYPASRISIKLIPSQLLWRFNAYGFGLEHGLSNNLGIEYKIALVHNGNNFDDDEIYFNNKSGFKSSIMLKNYNSDNGSIGSIFSFFNGDNYGESTMKSFIGFEAFYNQIKFDRTRTFRFDCQNGCEYFERVTYGLKMEEVGARINIGFITELYGPVGFEATWAVGFSHRSFNGDSRKPKDFERMFGRLYNEDSQGLILALNLDIKLVIDLK